MPAIEPSNDDVTNYQRVEQGFHDRVWATANEFARVERAVSDARQLAYAILKHADPETQDTLRYMATMWLDANGRDRLRERPITGITEP